MKKKKLYDKLHEARAIAKVNVMLAENYQAFLSIEKSEVVRLESAAYDHALEVASITLERDHLLKGRTEGSGSSLRYALMDTFSPDDIRVLQALLKFGCNSGEPALFLGMTDYIFSCHRESMRHIIECCGL